MLRQAAAVLQVLLAAAAASGARAQEFNSALAARLSLTDVSDSPIARPKAGDVFRIAIDLDDNITRKPAANVSLEGWIRPVEASNLPCAQAAQSFRVTRRLPSGAIDLSGSLLLSVNDDASFGIVDPRFDLASANMLKAGRLAEAPAAVAVNFERQEAYFALAQAGEVHIMNLPSGDLELLSKAAGRPIWIASAGDQGAWVARVQPNSLALNRPGASELATIDPGIGALTVGEPTEDGLVTYVSSGRATVVDRRSGKVVSAFDGPAGVSGVALVPGSPGLTAAIVFLASDGRSVDLRYIDAVDRPVVITLPFPASMLKVAPDGSYLFALDADGKLSIVDLARGKAVQAAAFIRPIREIEFADNIALFLYADTSAAAVLSLSSINDAEVIKMREVRLGAAVTNIPPDAKLLTPMGDRVLAVHRDTGAAFVIDEHSMTIGAPPMNAVSLRGGVPRSLTLAPRGFREVRPGHYVAGISLPAGGDYELVMTTGVRGLSSCMAFSVDGDRPVANFIRATILLADADRVLRAGQSQHVAFSLVGEDGTPLDVKHAAATLQAMSFHFRRKLQLTGVGGRLGAELTLGLPGPYVVQVEPIATDGKPPIQVAPLVMDVSP